MKPQLRAQAPEVSKTLEIIGQRTARAVSSTTASRGGQPLPSWTDSEDVEQEVHVRLCTAHGPAYLHQLERVLSTDADEASVRKQINDAICGAVNSVRSRNDKRRQRGLPKEISIGSDALDREEKNNAHPFLAVVRRYIDPSHRQPPCPPEVSNAEMDLREILSKFNEPQKTIADRMLRGMGPKEIGHELGMDHRRVSEMLQPIREALRSHFGFFP